MPNLRINTLDGRPLLDISTYARRGPRHRDRLSTEEIALIGRTVSRTPEVMVKVLSKDSNSVRSVGRHLDYIGRYGDLELETDAGDRVQGRGAGRQLVEDWDLDLDRDRKESKLMATAGRAPKLAHKIVLSMPPGTPAKGVLEAARNFAREEFALKHRYALVLHTDEPHPHVHLVVKAVNEQGERLSIRKATLRVWRLEFARHLRGEGIAANATERAVRCRNWTHKIDGIYRASLRGDSTHTFARAQSVAANLFKYDAPVEPGKSVLIATRRQVERGWHAAIDILAAQGQRELAASARLFIDQVVPPSTDNERLAAMLTTNIQRIRERDRDSGTR